MYIYIYIYIVFRGLSTRRLSLVKDLRSLQTGASTSPAAGTLGMAAVVSHDDTTHTNTTTTSSTTTTTTGNDNDNDNDMNDNNR